MAEKTTIEAKVRVRRHRPRKCAWRCETCGASGVVTVRGRRDLVNIEVITTARPDLSQVKGSIFALDKNRETLAAAHSEKSPTCDGIPVLTIRESRK